MKPQERKRHYAYKKANWDLYNTTTDELLDRTNTLLGPSSCLPLLTKIISTAAKRAIPQGSNKHIAEILPESIVKMEQECNEARIAYECGDIDKQKLDEYRSTLDISIRNFKSDQIHKHLSKLQPGKNMDWRFLRS
eukprot:Tbor_TRINITY_DN9005_c0_g1::TRINITY_DN9005_c0_g1_i1::g.17769::m.17769